VGSSLCATGILDTEITPDQLAGGTNSIRQRMGALKTDRGTLTNKFGDALLPNLGVDPSGMSTTSGKGNSILKRKTLDNGDGSQERIHGSFRRG